MKNTFNFIGKLILSGMLAVILLSAFCLIYDNPPLAIRQPDGFTNYKYENNAFWSTMTEGAGFGWTNNIGYNDRQDVSYSDADALFLGSSHTECFQLPQNKNFVSLTQDLLLSDSTPFNDIKCVNLGISSHYLNVSLSNLESLLKTFPNAKYIIIEMQNLSYTPEEFNRMLSKEYHEEYQDNGILGELLRRIPVIRTLKKQLDKISISEVQATSGTDPDYRKYQESVSAVIKYLKSLEELHEIQFILLHHCTIGANDHGDIHRQDDPKLSELFCSACQDSGITYLDMADSFVEYYNKTYQMPYGFANSVPGSGHLNETGHMLIAETIYSVLSANQGGE